MKFSLKYHSCLEVNSACLAAHVKVCIEFSYIQTVTGTIAVYYHEGTYSETGAWLSLSV